MSFLSSWFSFRFFATFACMLSIFSRSHLCWVLLERFLRALQGFPMLLAWLLKLKGHYTLWCHSLSMLTSGCWRVLSTWCAAYLTSLSPSVNPLICFYLNFSASSWFLGGTRGALVKDMSALTISPQFKGEGEIVGQWTFKALRASFQKESFVEELSTMIDHPHALYIIMPRCCVKNGILFQSFNVHLSQLFLLSLTTFHFTTPWTKNHFCAT